MESYFSFKRPFCKTASPSASSASWVEYAKHFQKIYISIIYIFILTSQRRMPQRGDLWTISAAFKKNHPQTTKVWIRTDSNAGSVSDESVLLEGQRRQQQQQQRRGARRLHSEPDPPFVAALQRRKRTRYADCHARQLFCSIRAFLHLPESEGHCFTAASQQRPPLPSPQRGGLSRQCPPDLSK